MMILFFKIIFQNFGLYSIKNQSHEGKFPATNHDVLVYKTAIACGSAVCIVLTWAMIQLLFKLYP